MKHNPNCAVVRAGDLRAFCDCPIGERERAVARLRYSASEFMRMAEDSSFRVKEQWELVAEILGEEADVIERNEH